MLFIALIERAQFSLNPKIYVNGESGVENYEGSFMDYFFERRKLNIQDSVEQVRYYFGIAFAVGLLYSFLFLMPWGIGAVIGPIVGVVWATLTLVNKENSKALSDSNISD